MQKILYTDKTTITSLIGALKESGRRVCITIDDHKGVQDYGRGFAAQDVEKLIRNFGGERANGTTITITFSEAPQ